jgi:hypothetical protein
MGLLALPSILLQDSIVGIVIQAGYVIMLSLTHGRRFRLLPNIILLASVSSAHLLQPHGLHLFSIGNFPITVGALLLGARKAFTLIALLYLSHYMVTGRPQFPGRLGKLVSLQFYYFERITTSWRAISPKRPFIPAIDRLLIVLSAPGNDSEIPSSNSLPDTVGSMATGTALLANGTHLILLWTVFVLARSGILPTF